MYTDFKSNVHKCTVYQFETLSNSFQKSIKAFVVFSGLSMAVVQRKQ